MLPNAKLNMFFTSKIKSVFCPKFCGVYIVISLKPKQEYGFVIFDELNVK